MLGAGHPLDAHIAESVRSTLRAPAERLGSRETRRWYLSRHFPVIENYNRSRRVNRAYSCDMRPSLVHASLTFAVLTVFPQFTRSYDSSLALQHELPDIEAAHGVEE